MKKRKMKTKNNILGTWIKSVFAIFCLAYLVTSCAADEDLNEPQSFQEKYVGVWDCEENTGNNAPQFYTVTISAGTSEEDLIISNLYNLPTTLNAVISGINISIPTQTSNGLVFSGSGKANADFEQISLTFSVNDSATADQVTALLHPN